MLSNLRKQILANEWNWDYGEFCRRLNLDKDKETSKEKWFSFKKLAEGFKLFGNNEKELEIIFGGEK